MNGSLPGGPEDTESTESSGLARSAMDRLVLECVAGDQAAMRALYEECAGRVFALVQRMVGPSDAEDVTQQVFLQVFRKIRQFSGQAKFETWMYRVAVNEALQHIRRRKRRHSGSLIEDTVVAPTSSQDDLELANDLEQALAKLPPDLRAVFLLREKNELSYREIAEALDIPEGTVGSRLNKARRELRNEMVNLGWGE